MSGKSLGRVLDTASGIVYTLLTFMKKMTLQSNLSALILCLLLVGCGGKVIKIEGPAELPSDLKDKFEVKETPAALTAQSPEAQGFQSALSAKKVKTPKAKKKELAAKAAAAAKAEVRFPNRRPPKEPIYVGERHTLTISYFGMKGGDFLLDVMPFKSVNDRKVYHLKGTAVSSPVFSLFYRLNDMVESFVDYDGLFSHRFHIVLDESKQNRDSLELFDQEKKQTFYWNRWSRPDQPFVETKEYAPIPDLTQDTLSSLFYLRTIPLPTGAVISIPVTSEGKYFEAVVTVLRREVLDTAIGKIPAIVVQPEMKFQGILKKQGDSFIWLSDDDRRYILRIEAKVKIGTIMAVLKNIEPGTTP